MNKDNNKSKKVSRLYFIAALCFYFVSIINFLDKDNAGMGGLFLCLGTTNLCLGSIWLNKNKNDK